MMALREAAVWVVLSLAALGLTYCKGHSDATEAAKARQTAALLEQSEKFNEEREKAQKDLDAISADWRKQLADLKKDTGSTIAGLRSNGVRLSVALADAKVRCVTGDGRPLADGRAELRGDFAEALVGEAKRADATVRALQGAIKKLKGEQ